MCGELSSQAILKRLGSTYGHLKYQVVSVYIGEIKRTGLSVKTSKAVPVETRQGLCVCSQPRIYVTVWSKLFSFFFLNIIIFQFGARSCTSLNCETHKQVLLEKGYHSNTVLVFLK